MSERIIHAKIVQWNIVRYAIATKTNCRRETATICPATCDLDLLNLKVVSESSVTWATSVPILVALGLSVLDLGPMYATDRQTSDSIIA